MTRVTGQLASDGQQGDDLSRLPQPDIDTQIEDARTAFWEKMTSLVLEYDLYTFDPNIKEMERDLMNAYDEATQALLDTAVQEARIDENQRWANGYAQVLLDYPDIDEPELFMKAKGDFEDRIKQLKATSKEDK